MKVVLVSRSKSRGRFSLETLFAGLAQEMRREIDVIEYPLTSTWGSWRDVRALRRMRADVYHITGDIHQMGLVLPRRKTVVTVADLNHYLYDMRGIRRWVFKRLWFDLPLSRVSVVTAISCKTKHDLEENCPGIRDEVRVVECCYSSRYVSEPSDFNVALPRVLFIGTAPHKNLNRLAAALEGICCRLVIVGSVDGPTRTRLKELGVEYENHVGLSIEALHEQYVKADLVAFVSEREGFGLPIIEAQAVGRPVVTSNVSPMCEVAGDGACLVDPFDVAAIRAGVVRIIDSRDYRHGLIEAGLQNVRRFSVETVAAEYLDVYREVAGRVSRGRS